jgi:cellulose biosynthesis protein BcsQ
MNSLVASDYFLVPCGAEYLPVVGLSLLSDSIMRMKTLAPQLNPLGVVLTLYSHNERICRLVETSLRKEIAGNLFNTKIRVNINAQAAPSVQKTSFDNEASEKGRGTQDFTALAAELLERLETCEHNERRVANG